jgi:hypothetical protein
MINGVVNAQREATIQLVPHDPSGQPHDVEMVGDADKTAVRVRNVQYRGEWGKALPAEKD